MISIEEAREWYQTSDAVHNFEHILRVLQVGLTIAEKESADPVIVQTAILLHDAEGSLPHNIAARASHHERSALFAGQILIEHGWEPDAIAEVQHCIRAHRYRSTEAPQSLAAKVVFDADKLDAIGAIGVARAIAYAGLHDTPFYEEPSAQFLANGQLADGEQHSAYHEFVFKLSKIKDRLYTNSAQQMAKARHDFMVDYFRQLQAEFSGAR